MSLSEKTLEFVDGQSVFIIHFKLTKLPRCLVDDLFVEMKLQNKQEEILGNYSTKLKVFSNTEGLTILNSIESILRTGNGFTIKFFYSGMLMEGLLTEKNEMMSINKPCSVDDSDDRINNIVNQIDELRNLIFLKRERSPRKESIENTAGNVEVINQLEERIITLEDTVKNYEKMSEFMKETLIKIENRINELDNKYIELKSNQDKLSDIKINSSVGETNIDQLFDVKFNSYSKDISNLKQELSSSLIFSENKQQKLIEEVASLKTWSSQTETLLFNINQTINNLNVSSRRVYKNSTEPIQFGSEYTSEASGSRGGSIRTPTLGSAPDSPRKVKTERIEIFSPTGSRVEEEPKRKKLHSQKKSLSSKTLKDLSSGVSGPIGSKRKTVNDVHGTITPRGDACESDKVFSIVEETTKKRSSSSISSKSPRPKAAVIDKDNLKEEFERKQALKQKEQQGSKGKNDLIFKELIEGEVMHLICNEEKEEEKMVREWLEENIKTVNFWDNFDSQRPKGVLVICKERNEGNELKNRLEMMFGEMNIGILGLEEEKESNNGDNYIQITIQENRVEDKEDRIKNLIKTWK